MKLIVIMMCFIDVDVYIYFWFFFLVGFFEFTFDFRVEICILAFEVLFDMFKFYGGLFVFGFWLCVYGCIFFFIFDYVCVDIMLSMRMIGGDVEYEVAAEDIDDWLYGTCTRCFEFVVDLVV